MYHLLFYLFLNLSLIRRVQIANRYTLGELIARQHNNLNTSTPTMNTAKQKRLRDEHRLTKTLVAVVIVFLICNTFTIVSYPGFVRFITRKEISKLYLWWFSYTTINNKYHVIIKLFDKFLFLLCI